MTKKQLNSYKLKKKLNLIFFLPNFSAGGAGKSILKICENINYFEYSIYIISLGKNYYKKQFKNLDSFVIELENKPLLNSLINILEIVNKINKKNKLKTCLISNINYSNVILPLFFNKYIKVILIERTPLYELDFYNGILDYIKKKIIKSMINFSYSKSYQIIANSNYIKKELSNILEKKIITIHPNILITKHKKIYKKKLNLLWVGRISREKNFYDMIKSLDYLENIDFMLTIISNEKINLDEFNLSQNSQKKIKFKIFSNNIEDEFKKAHIFISTSIYEGFPNVVAEAVNYECLIIASKSQGGIRDIIKSSKFGFFYRLYDHKDLAKKIAYVISNYKKLKQMTAYSKKKLSILAKNNNTKYKDLFINISKTI
tara:strand:+ start:2635 stop:3756 length:1122 start_codon:yes stop_codon:yes gene_type:complete